MTVQNIQVTLQGQRNFLDVVDDKVQQGLIDMHSWTKYPILGCVPAALIAVIGVIKSIAGLSLAFTLALPAVCLDNSSLLLLKSFEMIPKGIFWTVTGVLEIAGNLFDSLSHWLSFCDKKGL